MASYSGIVTYSSLRSNLVNLPSSISTLLYSSNIVSWFCSLSPALH